MKQQQLTLDDIPDLSDMYFFLTMICKYTDEEARAYLEKEGMK